MNIKTLVDRFLTWPLPVTVVADGCATNPNYAFPRSGTNLLNAIEAEAMLVYVLGLEDEFSLDCAPPPASTNRLTDEQIEAIGVQTGLLIRYLHGGSTVAVRAMKGDAIAFARAIIAATEAK